MDKDLEKELEELIKEKLEDMDLEDFDFDEEESECCGCEECSCKEEEINDVEEAMGILALEEEAKRLVNIEKPFEPRECVKIDEFHKDGMLVAETMISMVKLMVENGLDYNNAMAVSANYITQKQNVEIEKIRNIQIQQAQI